jgi:hypothetical protein
MNDLQRQSILRRLDLKFAELAKRAGGLGNLSSYDITFTFSNPSGEVHTTIDPAVQVGRFNWTTALIPWLKEVGRQGSIGHSKSRKAGGGDTTTIQVLLTQHITKAVIDSWSYTLGPAIDGSVAWSEDEPVLADGWS